MNEDTSRLTKLINDQINLIESLDKDDERRSDEIKILTQLIDRSCECWKIDNQFCENEARLRNDKEIKEIDEKLKKVELDLRERQLKADKTRTIMDFVKGFISVGAFVGFELMAHVRDMSDVVDRNQMHVKKNPFKLKLW